MADNEFTQYLCELESPNTDGYDFFVKNEGEGYNLEIYRQFEKSTGLYRYKGYGELTTVDLETAKKVYCDLEYRKKWDSYCNDLRVLTEDEERQIIYWRVAYPWPLSHRDYVFLRKTQLIADPDRWCIIGRSDASEKVDVVKSVVRVGEYEQTIAFQRNEAGTGTKVFMYYFDNPGGSLPTWVINWAAKTGVPQFMTTLKNACEKYTD